MAIEVVYDLIILLAAGLFAATLARLLNISILIGYLVVGCLIGPGVLDWVHDDGHELAHFAEVGVFLLLFSIGLEFSISDLRRLGRHLFVGGSVQMALVAIPVVLILRFCALPWQPAILVSAAIAFSSTVLVFRTLTEFGHTQHEHGRRAIGILLFQDAALVPLLLLVPLLTGSDDPPGWTDFVELAAISLAFIVAVLVARYSLGRWIIPLFANLRSRELIVLSTLVVLSSITLAAHEVGLPPSVGAFAAGLALNGNRWSHQIDALVLPFRESFSAIFFVSLGLIVNPLIVITEPSLLLIGLPLTIVIKAAAAFCAFRLTGLSTRPAIGMGLGLAHVGEFAFVLVLTGVDAGVLKEVDYQRVVAISVGSLILTPVLMNYGLKLFQPQPATEDCDEPLSPSVGTRNCLVVGAGLIGRRLTSHLETLGYDICLLDLSPLNLLPFAQLGFRTVSGDATQRAVLQRAGGFDSGLVIVCVPDDLVAIQIVTLLRRHASENHVLVRCRYQQNIAKLQRVGASQIVAEESEATLAFLKLIDRGQSPAS